MSDPGDGDANRWEQLCRRPSADEYAARFERLASDGTNVHGEADCCSRLVPPPARVLDAGCGTGRVAIELARRGYECVGVDVDAAMLDVARRASSDVRWVRADLVGLALLADERGGDNAPEAFDLVVSAGNVIPLLAAGSEAGVVDRLATHLRPGGVLVAGFGLDVAHLPLDHVPFSIDDYDRWCDAVGLVLRHRWSTWEGAAWAPRVGYAVSVHEHRS